MSESASENASATPTAARGSRKVLIGLVTGDKADKSRRVEVERQQRHRKYGKFLRRRTVCHVHDEENASQRGDLVEIMETRPLSKLKRWRLVRIVRKSGEAAVAAAVAGDEAAKAEVQASAPPTEEPPASTDSDSASAEETE